MIQLVYSQFRPASMRLGLILLRSAKYHVFERDMFCSLNSNVCTFSQHSKLSDLSGKVDITPTRKKSNKLLILACMIWSISLQDLFIRVDWGNGNGREQIRGEWWGSCSAISCPPARQETSKGETQVTSVLTFLLGKLETPRFQLQLFEPENLYLTKITKKDKARHQTGSSPLVYSKCKSQRNPSTSAANRNSSAGSESCAWWIHSSISSRNQWRWTIKAWSIHHLKKPSDQSNSQFGCNKASMKL